MDSILKGQNGDAVKSLSEKFLQTDLNKLLSMDENARRVILNDIAQDIYNLILKGGGL
jgi:hypothetical protein